MQEEGSFYLTVIDSSTVQDIDFIAPILAGGKEEKITHDSRLPTGMQL